MRKEVKIYIVSSLVSLCLFVLGLIFILINPNTIDVLGLILFIIGTAGVTVIVHSLIRGRLKKSGIDPKRLNQTEKNRLENSRRLSGYLTFILSLPILLALTGLAYVGFFHLILPIWLFISFLLYVPIDNIFYVRRYKSILKLRDKKPFYKDQK